MSACKTENTILVEGWTKLYTEAAYNKKFEYAVFKDLFVRTFDMVQPLAHQDCIDKKYITLLMVLNDFHNTWNMGLGEVHRATCHLTHEMAKDRFSCIYAQNEIPVMVDSKNKEYSYKDVDLLIEIIKNCV